MALKTNNSYIDFDVKISGNSVYNTTTVPSGQVKIKASDGAANDYFGYTTTVGSGRIVVSALGDDDNGSESGAAYIFDLAGTQLAKIKASDGSSGDSFGIDVAIGCNRIVVGAYTEDSVQTGSGAAYIFDLNGTQLAKIKASDASTFSSFGSSVAVGSGRIVIGAYQDGEFTGSPGGSAYIFDLNGTELAKIRASDRAASDGFGSSVAIGSGRIVVGSYADDDNGSSSGSAYIFDLNGNQLAKIKAPDGAFGDFFGLSVAVGSGRIVIGAPEEPSGFGTTTGFAYIFDLNGNLITKIVASDGTNGDNFGSSVAVKSGRIIVGAPNDDDNGFSSGSTYIFDLNGTQLAKIKASDAATEDGFGASISIDSGKIVVGAYGDDDTAMMSGAAYIYTTPKLNHMLDLLD